MCFNAERNLGKSHAAPLGALYSIYTKSPGSRLGLHHVATIVAKNSKVSAIRLETARLYRVPCILSVDPRSLRTPIRQVF